MYASIRALLSGIIDYAGLFPPAKLPMDQAVRDYLRYRTEPESWMLGRFICPAARLGELAAFREEIVQLPGPLTISALGRGGADATEFLDGVRADLADATKFREQLGDKAAVESYEVKLPPGLCAPDRHDELAGLITDTEVLWETDWLIAPFYEPPSADLDTVHSLMEILGSEEDAEDEEDTAPQAVQTPNSRRAGLKLRCGGDLAAMPTAEQLGLALGLGLDFHVPLKFTAGLHHPFRHFDKASQTTMHGFLSLFAAGAVGYAHDLSEATIQRIIADKNPRHFRFTDVSLDWNNLSALPSQIAVARQTLVTSFGSCSFDEPRNDLRALGLIS